jgi:hypothetical protein
MTFKEIMKAINDSKYTSLWDADEYLEYDLKIKPCEEGLNIDKRRWYEISTSVYQISDRFLGVRGLSQCYSEMSSAEDCMCTSEAFEMEEVKTVTYVKKAD